MWRQRHNKLRQSRLFNHCIIEFVRSTSNTAMGIPQKLDIYVTIETIGRASAPTKWKPLRNDKTLWIIWSYKNSGQHRRKPLGKVNKDNMTDFTDSTSICGHTRHPTFCQRVWFDRPTDKSRKWSRITCTSRELTLPWDWTQRYTKQILMQFNHVSFDSQAILIEQHSRSQWRIRLNMRTLGARNKRIKLLLVPGHSDTERNNKTDQLPVSRQQNN